MLKEFQKYIRSNNLISKNDEILLAISGGIDSVVMLDLFDKSGINYAISHCNFKLRMFESDDDELFVRQLAHKYNTDIFVNWCNTTEYAKENKLSIQEAARDLRYSWFNQVCGHNNYSKIAIAHHQDDNIETFFINLSRGAGIKGLKSIPIVRDNIIRPLMFATRNEVELYAKEHMLEYREDSSNRKDYYLRNNIRHNLIPTLESISPGYKQAITKSIDNLVDSDLLLQSVVDEKISTHFKTEPNGTKKVSIAELQKLVPYRIWMYYILNEFGFIRQISDSICNAIEQGNSTGLRFASSNHELLIDRKQLLLREISKKASTLTYLIKDSDPYITTPLKINFEKGVDPKSIEFTSNNSIAYFDYDKLEFPLSIRKWQAGDKIIPFGMKGSKLISDILINNKVDSFEKENVYVILSGKKVVWLVGYRASNDFKISDNTKTYFMMELISSTSGFDLELFK